MARTIQKIKAYVLIFFSVNLITLQKLLLQLNKKKNKKGFLFKTAYYISNISNLCLGVALKESEDLYKKYGN